MQYKIICDSGCDFTATELLGTTFQRVPMTLLLDGRAVVDEGPAPVALLESLRRAGTLRAEPPTEEDWLRAFSCEADMLFVLATSAELGDSYLAAYRARKRFIEAHPEKKIHVFNTRTISAGILLAARKIHTLVLSGCSFQQIVDTTERDLLDTHTLFLAADTRAFRQHSLLRRAVHWNALPGASPVLDLTRSGTLHLRGHVLGKKRTISLLASSVAELYKPSSGRRICVISHCGCPEQAVKLSQRIDKGCQFQEIIIVAASGLSALYGGKGGLAVAF